MKFLYPEFLWALLLLAIPIIIHLFNFKRYKTLYFSSLSFIKHVDQQTRSTQKLKHLLVLICRMLAFTFLILAFAQPYFSSKTDSSDSKTKLASIYIDNSFSMQSRGSEGELLSEARQKAIDLVNDLPMDTRFMVLTNELNGREERLLNKVEALEKIDHLTYSPLSRSINDVIAWQEDKVTRKEKEDNSKLETRFYLFSDFQKSTSDLKTIEDTLTGKYYPIQLIAEARNNLYIDSVWFSNPNHQLNARNEFNFRVRNTSSEKLENVELEITIEGFKKSLFVDIPAKGQKTSMISHTDKSTGIKKGKINVIDKHVFFDDAFFFSYEVQSSSNVLIINGEDYVDNIELIYSLDDFYKSQSTNISAINREDFNTKDLVILNGVNELSSGISTYLKEYTSTGGTVALFPGKEPQAPGYNSFLTSTNLPSIGKTISSGTKIKSIEYKSPFFKGMFEKESENLNLPAVSKVFQPLSNNSESNNLITLQNGLPIFSFSQTNGKVFMFYSSLHPDYGKFATDALFSSILLRLGEISKRQPPLFIEIGGSTKYPVFNDLKSEEALHIKNSNYDFIPEQTQISGVTYLALNKMDDFSSLLAGNYDISNSKNQGSISLNYNRVESDLTLLEKTEIVNLFGSSEETEVNFSQISSDKQFSVSDIDKPFAYWKICIVLTIIFVLLEMLVIRFIK